MQLRELLPWLEPLRRGEKTGKVVVQAPDPGQAVRFLQRFAC